MQKNSGLKNFLFPIFIILLLLFVLEGTMRLGGWVLSAHQRQMNARLTKQKSEYRILCLGESTTARGGNDSWPEQLEEVLKEKNINVKVINGGIEGIVSDAITAKLKGDLDKYQPDLVIIMMGVNDWQGTVPFEQNSQTGAILFFKDLRVFKLFRAMYFNLGWLFSKVLPRESAMSREPNISKALPGESAMSEDYPKSLSIQVITPLDEYIHSGNTYCEQQQYALAEDLLKKAVQMEPKNGRANCSLMDCYKLQEKYEQVFALAKEYSKYVDPDHYDIGVCTSLGDVYFSLRQYPQAEQMYIKALDLNPKYEPAYTGLGLCYAVEGKQRESYALAQKIAQEGVKNDRLLGFVAIVYNQNGEQKKGQEYERKAEKFRATYYNPVTRHNYRFVADLLRQRGIRLICMQYPLRRLEPLIKMFASVEGITFLENREVFQAALEPGKYSEYFTDNFAGDFGHCTREGNRIIAQNVANLILREIF
jgi:tetratricopeptide (TPR) repeat protein